MFHLHITVAKVKPSATSLHFSDVLYDHTSQQAHGVLAKIHITRLFINFNWNF